MTDVQETPVAAALAALMHHRNVTAAQLARRSGVAANTISYILSGTTATPKPRTLQRLARGLAEDAWTREVDPAVSAENERVLAVAAGYAPPTVQDIPTHAELSLYYLLASRDGARAWLEVIRTLRALPPDVVRSIPSRLDTEAVVETIVQVGDLGSPCGGLPPCRSRAAAPDSGQP